MEEKNTKDLSALIGGLLNNPGAVSALTSLLGNGGNGLPESLFPAKSPPSCSVPSSCSAKPSRREDRKKLLLALKPFLAPEKQGTVDKLLLIEEALTALQSKIK
ncbi:MAG: hypothetical protein MJ078_05200 [Clostridia bacterium]|nr:hypothetical protein [Clostridia bacterium]